MGGDEGRRLKRDLAVLDCALARYLGKLRERGRSSLSDAVRGALIETGEAETLLAELAREHSSDIATQSLDATATEDWQSQQLARAVAAFTLSPFDASALLLALSVEIDSRYGRVIAYLNDHAGSNRPTVGLALGLFAQTQGGSIGRFSASEPLRSGGLITLDESAVRADATIDIDAGFRELWFACEATPPQLHSADLDVELALPVELEARISSVAKSVSTKTIAVTGPAGSGRDAIARALARSSTKGAFTASISELLTPRDVIGLRRSALWFDAVPVLSAQSDEELVKLPGVLRELNYPAIVATSTGGYPLMAEATAGDVIELRLPELSFELRERIWTQQMAASGLTMESGSGEIAKKFRLGPAMIGRAVRIVLGDGRRSVSQGRLDEICRRLPLVKLGALAQRLECPFSKDELIVPAETTRELDLALSWSRHARELFDKKGAAAGLHAPPGLACLFAGPPGTGKTMAAQVLAKQVGLDLYRVDLSRVVSKYIGETEKNLAVLFDEAAAANAVLLFDEADTLFAKRTDVKDAQDRHANVETGFLLQRMESHPGISILATNLRKNIDEAFLRRLQVIADFPRPGPAERRRIWELKLPKGHLSAADVDLDLLADSFDVSGGEIRNSVITAYLLASDEQAPLAMRHVVIGLWREMQKAGRILDPDRLGAWREHVVLGVRSV